MSSKTISTGFEGSRRGGAAAVTRVARRLALGAGGSVRGSGGWWVLRRGAVVSVRRSAGRRPWRLFAEQVAEAILAEARRAQDEVHLHGLPFLGPLVGVVDDVGAVGAPGDVVGAAVRHRADRAALAAGRRHGEDVAERALGQADVGDPPAVGRPGDAAVRARQVPLREHALLLRLQVDDAQLRAVADEGDRFAVRRDTRGAESPVAARVSWVSSLAREVEEEQMPIPLRSETYTMRRLSGSQATCDSRAIVRVTRTASPPSRAAAAQISPRATNATLRPSGDSARSGNPLVRLTCSTAGVDGAPRAS
jgi:hypothetical protein